MSFDSVDVDCPHPVASIHNSKDVCTGYHRLEEHPQHGTACWPEPLQKVESALTVLVHSLCVLHPVQLAVQVYSQVLVVLYRFHVNNWIFRPAKVCHQLLRLTCADGLAHTTQQKESTTPLYSASFPSLMHATIAESLRNFCRWQDVKMYVKYKV